ncbi:uncharacterized protein LOC144468021 isoform X1 [Augochlora pura]
MNPTLIKSWLQRGEFEKLENVVLEGRGARLLGEQSPDLRTRVFLKGLPNYLTKISQVHEAVARGSLAETQRLIAEEPKKKLAIAKDPTGRPLLHKAVYHDQQDIVEWLVQNYPITVQQRDREGRTALHYCAACKDPDAIWDVLIEGGCDASICDKKGNPAAYYLENSSEIELPETESMHRRKTSSAKEPLDVKPSNIRIWIHNRNIGKLQQVLWEGHGNKLRRETSNNPRVKRFLEAVPFIMGTVKEVHTATVQNDIEDLRKKIDSTSPIVLCSKDCNGLNALHKAAGLGFTEIAREILTTYPSVVEAQDNDGKTALHYAASVKDDDLYNLLTEYGADESKLDNRSKAAAFYKNRPSDIDQTLLTVIPEAPRVSGTSYPKHWDWRILEAEVPRGMKKAVSADIDSAFGSAESASKKYSRSMEQIKRGDGEQKEEDTENVEEANTEEGAEQAEEAAEDGEAGENEENAEAAEGAEEAGEGEEANEEQAEEAEGKPEEAEEKSSDDDVVTGAPAEEAEEAKEEEEPAAEEEAKEEEEPAAEEEAKEEEPAVEEEAKEDAEEEVENAEPEGEEAKEDDAEAKPDDVEQEDENKEERNEPSTGDSGVDDPANDEDQVIAGEHEELPDAEVNEASMSADPEIEKLLENGNMEQLATLVLNGEGRRLVGRHSRNPELQAFIDRVPSYMGKIHAVHMAAREGNLRDLQSALDRRKFAVARDGSSPRGSTPLHVAVIFGNTTIIRYLAGRFPETTNAIDLDGRTPLHYAATLADNGHYYNLLLHLGANPQVQDNFGQKADYYKQDQSEFSHKSLLRDFGANESLADEMLTDKDDQQLEIPIFREEEGRYLASSLGDPLLKGLTEVANARPKDPVTYLATYLYNFANKTKDEEQEANVLIIPEREEGVVVEDGESENPDDDAGYPQSPGSDVPESAFSNPNRDEHGQSVVHFAAIRSYSKDGLFHLLQESQVNIGFRDELYRTARDVAELANIRENVEEINRYVAYLAARGETEKLVELLLEGYDHILDVEDGGVNIVEIAAERGRDATVQFLQSIPNYEAQREEVHHEIRTGNIERAKELLHRNNGGGKLLAMGKNPMSRCALHIAVLRENEELVEFIAKMYPETLRIGDNLERTALHYAMGLETVERLSNILTKAGAKRTVKDLKSRQPSYYFMNKSEIERLQEEEESLLK